MSLTDYLEGLAFFLPTLGAALVAAGAVLQRRCRGLTGATRVVAFGLLALVGIALPNLIPGMLGILSRGTVLLAALLLVALVWRFVPRAEVPLEPELPGPPSAPFARFAGAVAVGAVTVWGAAAALHFGPMPSAFVDVVTFHFPGVARWIQDGSIWHIAEFVPDHAFGYYPNNGDLMTLAVVLPWKNDFLARLVPYPLLALTGFATYAIARELRAPAGPAALFAACVVAIPPTSGVAVLGLPDTFMLATFSAGALFLLRHSRTGRTTDLVLAGAGLGAALGTKWYGFPTLVAVLVVWTAAWLIARRPPHVVARQGGLLLGLAAAGAAPWLIRNLVQSGNPFFPAKVDPLGITVFDAPVDRDLETYGNSISKYLFDFSAWRHYFLPDLFGYMTLATVVLWVGLAVAALLAVRTWRSDGAQRGASAKVLAIASAAALMGVMYIFLPYTAQGPPGVPNVSTAAARYIVPALVLAAPAAAWAVGRLGRLGVVLEIGALAGLAHALDQTAHPGALKIAVAVAAVVALGAIGYWLSEPRRRAALTRRRSLFAAAVGALALVAVLAGFGLERRFNRDRYGALHPAVDFALANAPSGKRVGLAGIGFAPVVYPMFGKRFGNEVEYVGRFVDGMLRPYLHRTPFARALRRGRYDLVVVQLGAPLTRPSIARRQDRWVRELGYRRVAAGPDANLYAP